MLPIDFFTNPSYAENEIFNPKNRKEKTPMTEFIIIKETNKEHIPTLEEKVETLYDYIMVQSDRLAKLSNLLGYDHPVIKNKRWEVIGMEMAFEIVAGHNVTDHCIAKYQKKVGIKGYEKK